MILILAAATLISVLMGQGAEAVTIIAIVLLNAVMGFLQEYRTEQTLEALKELSAPRPVCGATARKKTVARTVVPGDVLLLEAGDKIAADAKLQSAAALRCNEAMLTGESVPAGKKAGDTVFMGCIATAGKAEAVVTATGMATEMGKIAGMMDEASEAPPLQEKLKQLGRFVAAACVVICLWACWAFCRGRFAGDAAYRRFAGRGGHSRRAARHCHHHAGAQRGRILRRGAVIRRLHAVETLGCASVICTDKTGTITQNKMTVKRIWTPGVQYAVSGDGYAVRGRVTRAGRRRHGGARSRAWQGCARRPCCARGRPLLQKRGVRVKGRPNRGGRADCRAQSGRGKRTWPAPTLSQPNSRSIPSASA